MADLRTQITEIVTGLALFGFRDLDHALGVRPRFITNVTDEHFERLVAAHRAGTHDAEFAIAWENGQVFARAADGLRGRPPWQVEWKGPHRPPAYEQIPADLRVDHVYLISCKYGSRILYNGSPAHVFDRLLAERRVDRSLDWFVAVAPEAYQELYQAALGHLDLGPDLPASVAELGPDHRARLKAALPKGGRWPTELREPYQWLVNQASHASAERWRSHLTGRAEREQMLWRLLRLAAAPYFVLGADADGSPLRYRVDTPWDFRNRFAIRDVDVWGDAVGQPTVCWRADVRDLEADVVRHIDGHVEVRWSHGRFASAPEAKVYLDTPHHEVAGYWPLT